MVAIGDTVTAERLDALTGRRKATVLEVNPDLSVIVDVPAWFTGIDGIRIRHGYYHPVGGTSTLPDSQELLGLLECFVDEDDCDFDHHGGCQTHGYLSLEPGEICPNEQARRLIKSAEEQS